MRRAGITAALMMAMVIAAPAAHAGQITVRVIDGAGRPVADAVVSLRPTQGKPPPPHVDTGYQVSQKDMQFHPFVSIVPQGATVAFPNLDPFRHHVYSFSTAKRFELKLFARDQTRSVTFDAPGVVAIGCNIHDSMSAYIYVTDTAWTARTAQNGSVVFRDAPAAAMTIAVWHPLLRSPGSVASRTIGAGGDHAETFTVALRPPPLHRMDGY